MFEMLFWIAAVWAVTATAFLLINLNVHHDVEDAAELEINGLMRENERLNGLLYNTHREFDQYLGIED